MFTLPPFLHPTDPQRTDQIYTSNHDLPSHVSNCKTWTASPSNLTCPKPKSSSPQKLLFLLFHIPINDTTMKNLTPLLFTSFLYFLPQLRPFLSLRWNRSLHFYIPFYFALLFQKLPNCILQCIQLYTRLSPHLGCFFRPISYSLLHTQGDQFNASPIVKCSINVDGTDHILSVFKFQNT